MNFVASHFTLTPDVKADVANITKLKVTKNSLIIRFIITTVFDIIMSPLVMQSS
jgi:hypothetical protein